MGVLSDQMRSRAVELDKALTQMMNTKPSIDGDTVRAVKASVLPELLIYLADMLEALENVYTLNGTYTRLQQHIRKNQEVREAAARGNWEELDAILNRETAPGAAPEGVSP